ncbi:hypothetical protein [Rhizobium sp. P28RR-XV]|uniref:hypothetical protein n=1 Tax=Rhizobium sp. P28RR-XV TaxID=2726737 RepID=UPI001456CA64|nr:hypothetical protein [Rhizobium sp. P28RR-XV]NLR85649.1 hypothetical protein [Rhizobium sp. P28RR-XV]
MPVEGDEYFNGDQRTVSPCICQCMKPRFLFRKPPPGEDESSATVFVGEEKKLQIIPEIFKRR